MLPEFRGRGSGDKRRSMRVCLRRTKSQSFGADNQTKRAIYDHVISMLPDDFERGEHL